MNAWAFKKSRQQKVVRVELRAGGNGHRSEKPGWSASGMRHPLVRHSVSPRGIFLILKVKSHHLATFISGNLYKLQEKVIIVWIGVPTTPPPPPSKTPPHSFLFYLLQVTKFLVKISHSEFLVMTKKNIFVYQLFCH